MAHKIKTFGPLDYIPQKIVHKRQWYQYTDKQPSTRLEGGWTVRYDRDLHP